VDQTRRPRPKPKGALFKSVLVVIALVIANHFITLPYYAIAPGQASPVNSAISVDEGETYEANGTVLFTTVSLIEVRPFDLFWSLFESKDEIVPEEEVIGNQSPDEYFRANELLMANSQQVSTAVALREAGYDVTETGSGAVVVGITPESPAEGILEAGDLITEVNGQPVSLSTDLIEVVQSQPVGAELSLTVESAENREAAERTEVVTTAPNPDDPEVPLLGIEIQTFEPDLETPFPIDVDLGEVGGPSAGLAIALATLDQLTPGELVGASEIAVTGTLDIEGNVGPVGGLRQKAAAVERTSDAELFLVPESEAEEAAESAPDGVRVVGVSNISDAIDALVENGGERPRQVG
jgi:Lon-like protease